MSVHNDNNTHEAPVSSGKKSFLFKEKVGVFESSHHEDFKPPVEVLVRLAQNGFKLRYKDKDFVATNLDEALKMIKVWFEKEMKESK